MTDYDDDDLIGFEAEPLLADDECDAEPISGAADPHKPRHRRLLSRFQAKKPKTIVCLLAVILFTLTTSGMLMMVPLFRLIEDAACHVHYKKPLSEKIDEMLCKVDEVQSPLAYLGGVSVMLSSMVSLIAALPYGVLADRIGRKPSFLLAYVGIIFAFAWAPFMLGVVQTTNLYIVMLGSLFFLLGGGVPVAINSLNAMAADVSPDLEKSTSFLYLSFGAVAGSLVGPFAAGILMEKTSPWFPIVSVFALTPIVLVILLFLPETLAIKLKDGAEAEQPSSSVSAKKTAREAINELRISFGLLKNKNILLIMVNFLIQPATFAAYSTTLSQHVSKYFGWTLAQTSYLLGPPLNVVHLIVIVLVPWVSGILTSPSGRFKLSAFSKDLFLTRVSMAILVLAALMEGFSQSAVLFITGLVVGTFGSAQGPLLRAIATSYVEPNQTSRLYSLMSVLDTSGAVIGGPVLAKLFNMGLERRGLWIGLPWFYIAALISVALLAIMFIQRPPDKPRREEQEEGGLGYQSAEEP